MAIGQQPKPINQITKQAAGGEREREAQFNNHASAPFILLKGLHTNSTAKVKATKLAFIIMETDITHTLPQTFATFARERE